MFEKEIMDCLKKQDGKVGFYYKNLVSGREMALNEEAEFEAASIIKLPIYFDIMRRYSANEIRMDELIPIKTEDLLPSCGAINLFSAAPKLDIRTLCNFMIALSDNTATNVLINYFGIEELNNGFVLLGLKNTKLERLLFDDVAAAQGRQNKFVIKEIMEILEKVYHKSFLKTVFDEEINQTLLNQQINYKIPGKMLEQVQVAHKTGDDDGISNDLGIVYAREPFLIAFASNNTDVTAFDDLIREISFELCFR